MSEPARVRVPNNPAIEDQEQKRHYHDERARTECGYRECWAQLTGDLELCGFDHVDGRFARHPGIEADSKRGTAQLGPEEWPATDLRSLDPEDVKSWAQGAALDGAFEQRRFAHSDGPEEPRGLRPARTGEEAIHPAEAEGRSAIGAGGKGGLIEVARKNGVGR